MIAGKHLGAFAMLPAAPGTCQVCARAHTADQPHDGGSLFYQYYFFNENGRWPTWGDALAHCTPDLQAAWKEQLAKHGVPAEKLEPSKGAPVDA